MRPSINSVFFLSRYDMNMEMQNSLPRAFIIRIQQVHAGITTIRNKMLRNCFYGIR